ncbi:hypothetical protein KM043_011561 [Ampulex compressa]|nr:hypothetical protein KM043_011561 [Ampulex compressa]
MKIKRKNEYDPDEEARLEKIVFGDPSDIISNLPDVEGKTKVKEDEVKVQNSELAVTEVIDVHSEIDENNVEIQNSELQNTKKPAWVDEDDIKYSVNIAVKAQNRRLPGERPEELYTQLLENKYKQLVGTPKWAELDRESDNQFNDSDEILKHSCHLEQPKKKLLPKNLIDIKALTAINKQTHTEGPIISSLEFHPSSTVALVAGTSGILSIFQVDGIENNKLHSMQYKKFPITCAKFLKDGTEILVGSQYHPHCHSYNLISGKTYRIPLPHGITNMKKYEVSPDGKILALCGQSGEIFLLSSSSKELLGVLKMNTKCKTMAFMPDSKTLITHGESNEMYVWDVQSRTCINRAIDDGCLSCASITISPSGQFLATGSKQGVVNIYDTKKVLNSKVPQPIKIIMNLVTSITALKFNPASEILAMASDKQPNAFRMVHIPTFKVFSNFPTFQTKLSIPKALDFSPGNGYLGITNNSGSALLYRLKHYGNY